MRQSLILIGAGGHCKSCIEVIESTGQYEIAGILDVSDKVGSLLAGYPVIGTDDALETLAAGPQFLITVGQIKSALLRQRLFTRLKALGKPLATIIAPSAIVATRVTIGEGSIVMHRTVINAGSFIGANCIINTGAVIEHDSILGDHVHLSTMAVINGDCHVGEAVFVGSGAVVANGITIAASAVIGAGAVVISDITEVGTYVGNPCHKLNIK
ncbi:acetyltransferase [Chitinophaga costaii]|nr:acetyltransferase [Chitinophaga costaii]